MRTFASSVLMATALAQIPDLSAFTIYDLIPQEGDALGFQATSFSAALDTGVVVATWLAM